MLPALVLEVSDVRATYERMKARQVEFTQEPVARLGGVDAGVHGTALLPLR